VLNDANGDGHHVPTDVLSAWLSEERGALEAVIRVKVASWEPEHDDPQIVAGYAFLFTRGGVIRYVRLSVDDSNQATYDYGTWTLAGHFVSEGTTTGERETNLSGPGAVTIAVPASVATAGDLLTDTFALTYDGIVSGTPVAVDQVPGGEFPSDPARGPDFRVGSCDGVELAVAPLAITGPQQVTISGKVLSGDPGVQVTISRRARTTITSQTMTGAGGTFSIKVPVRETTWIKAEGEGLESAERKVTVRARVTIRMRRFPNGSRQIWGLTRPELPGRLLLIRTTAFTASRSKQFAGGHFRFGLTGIRPGRYQVIYIPANNRAVRDVSNVVVVP
jgi:hypothetical protein